MIRTWLALTIAAALIPASTPAASGQAAGPGQSAQRFAPGEQLPGLAYRDVDVTDVDGDGLLDIVAPAHSFEGGLWLNGGDFDFSSNQIEDFGLGQDPEFPGWTSGVEPTVSEQLLYVYRGGADSPFDDGRSTLNLVWPPATTEPVHVRFSFHAGIWLSLQENAELTIEGEFDDSGRRIWVAAGVVRPGGRVVIEQVSRGLPIEAEIGPAIGPASIAVGPLLAHPRSNAFTLNVKDRHGLALADFLGDSRPDALWAVGGMGDNAELYVGLIDDQVFENRRGVFSELGPASGVTKTTCRGYEARVVDADHDGRMDLYVGCLGARPQLWQQRTSGVFERVKLSQVARTVYGSRWIDTDNDGELELVATVGNGVEVYRANSRGSYVRAQQIPLKGDARDSQNLQVADYDGNGFQDVLIAAPGGSALLTGSRGGFVTTKLAALGLPSDMVGAAWADIDSDGCPDLLAMPGGVFVQQRNGSFVASSELTELDPDSFASATFADLDNDGSRDVVANIDGQLTYARNTGAQGHWLELDLTGPPGNASAIGAWVAVTSAGRTLRSWVGSSDSSVFSQGHHRLYLGLGDSPTIERLTVYWPDGTTSRLRDVEADRVVHLDQDG